MENLKMAINNRCNFSLRLLFLIGQIILYSIGVQCVETINPENHQVRRDFVYLRNFNTSNIIDGILSQNWIENRECLTELNAIKNGLENHEEWAIRVVDSWGNLPSGILNGNLHELGSFSECFHIKRNGTPYKTQYCIGYGTLYKRKNNVLNSKSYYFETISLGLCFPATCAVKHLESVVNRAIRKDLRNMVVRIPKQKCQFEENITSWELIDFFAIGLFGVALFLMITSTGYDIYTTVHNQKKYQPFIVFSVFTNGEKLFSCKNFGPSSGIIQCIDGIRVITTMWVVFIHAFRYYENIPIHETAVYKEYLRTYRSVIFRALFPAETFLVISGFLVSYKMLKLLKKDGKLDVLSLYFNRLLRLTPVLAVMILIYTSILRFLGNGPYWLTVVDVYSGTCQRYWWSTLLHIQNYVNPYELCIGPSWYLSVDTQLFIISPALAYLIYRFTRTGILALVVLLLCSVGYMPFAYINNNITSMFIHTAKLYQPTHFRFPPWVIGFITGYILFKYPKGSIRIPEKLNWCAWTCVFISMSVVVIENYQNYQLTPNLTPLEYGLFESLSRIAWSISLSYIIFACIHNSGGAVNWFLSLPMWQPLSKLSFSIYLVHYAVLATTMFSLKTTPDFSEMAAFQSGVFVFVVSAFISIPLVLAFELPIDVIYKLTINSKGKKIHPITPQNKSTEHHVINHNNSRKIEKSDEKAQYKI